jgi:LacI family transcriptional regulator
VEIEAALKMMRGRVDGLVIMSPHIDAAALNENLPQHVPVTLLNCHVEGDAFDSVNIDNFGGASAIVRHLLSHGHTRIAIVRGAEENLDAAERLRGYRHALETGGGVVDPQYEIAGEFSEASGYEAGRNILSLSPRPTAVFASNDATAVGLLSALRDAGVRVPAEIALAGFDDIPISAYLTPALTTVHMGVHELGVLAVESVLRAVREKNTHRRQQVVLPTTLAIRESCGCDGGGEGAQRGAE